MKRLKFTPLHPKAILPSRGSENSCGLDIHSIEDLVLKGGERRAIRTGIAVEIPQEHYGRIAPRSGLAFHNGIDVLAGVIDSDYRGEILCLLINLDLEHFQIKVGDRIAQLIIEKVEFLTPEWSNSLSITQRDNKGFGSTGN